MSAPVRVGVVGAGSFGTLHIRTLSGLAEAELTAVVEPNEAGRCAVAQITPDVPIFGDFDSALTAVDAEAWVIATRTEAHIPLARQALETGAAVLIEKPMAVSVEEARSLSPLTLSDRPNLMLGHIVLFSPLFQSLLNEVRRRPPLRYFHFVRHRPETTAALFPEETPLTLTMVHDLYLAYALMNGAEPDRMTARLRPNGAGYDLATAEIEWPGGVWGSFTASFMTPPGMAADGFDRVELFGEGWAATVSLNPQPLQVWSDRAEWPVALDIHLDPPSGWLAEELRWFCRMVRIGEQPPVGARYEDGVRLQEWLKTLQASAENG